MNALMDILEKYIKTHKNGIKIHQSGKNYM